MAEVHDIIFCLNAMNVDGQGASANTILSAINPEYVPGLFSFSTIITILGIPNDGQQKLRIVLKNEDEELGAIDGMIPLIDDQSNLPDEYKGINLSIDWNNINFKRKGMLTLSVFIDQTKVADKSIYVKGKNQ